MVINLEEQPEFNFFPNSIQEEIEQNIRFLCMTVEGSLPLDRAFGLNREFLDKPINEARLILLPELIKKINKYEPRVNVINITYDGIDSTTGFLKMKLYLNEKQVF